MNKELKPQENWPMVVRRISIFFIQALAWVLIVAIMAQCESGGIW